MADVTIAADFGASLGRAIYSTTSGHLRPELLLLEPQVVQVPQKSIDNYEKYKMGQANPEDSAWVKFGETFFAVGFLALEKLPHRPLSGVAENRFCHSSSPCFSWKCGTQKSFTL